MAAPRVSFLGDTQNERVSQIRAIVAQLERLLVQRQRLVRRLEAPPMQPPALARSRRDSPSRDELLSELAHIGARQAVLLDALSGLIVPATESDTPPLPLS